MAATSPSTVTPTTTVNAELLRLAEEKAELQANLTAAQAAVNETSDQLAAQNASVAALGKLDTKLANLTGDDSSNSTRMKREVTLTCEEFSERISNFTSQNVTGLSTEELKARNTEGLLLAEATVLECSEDTKNALKAAKTAIAEQKTEMAAAVAETAAALEKLEKKVAETVASIESVEEQEEAVKEELAKTTTTVSTSTVSMVSSPETSSTTDSPAPATTTTLFMLSTTTGSVATMPPSKHRDV